jgi:mannose-1-phosphate guanylyltransferase/mannose-6-phosphate isomerase
MKSIILAGGEGTRLWPLSRKNLPKQFVSIGSEKTFLEQTLDRLLKISNPNDIFIITQESYSFLTKEIISTYSITEKNIILEPDGRNTAPAILLTMKFLLEVLKVKPDEVLFFTPSDHIIQPVEEFFKVIRETASFAKESIVVFGITPDRPETGYGYIETSKQKEKDIFEVKRFVEKPSLDKAREYITMGNFLWNSGMFMFSIEVMMENFKNYSPSLYDACTKMSYKEVISNYSSFEKISIDYAIMEKTTNLVCRKCNFTWSDVGSWESVYEISKKDENQNSISNNTTIIDSKRNLVVSPCKKLISLVDVEDLVVVDTDDALLVCNRSKTQRVKELVEKLKEQNKTEALEHRTVYRPWGSYTVLEEGERYKIKRIVVKTKASLSLQRHLHRSEHWVVIKGTALVEVDGKKIYLHENESTFIPKSSPHRLSNPGKIPLVIIEVQNGEYIGEDDIERLDDIYGRVSSKSH